MHLIYSALQRPASSDAKDPHQWESNIRYQAYKTVCEKYRDEIAAIQKYFPNWKPRFEQ